MDFAAIMQMIMMIISMIMQMIGGGTFPATLVADQDRPVYLASHQWECGKTYWQVAPTIEKDLFSGTVAIDCEVEGVHGGGLVEARRHLLSELRFSVSSVNAGPYVRSFEGLPSNAYDVQVQVRTAAESASFEGRTDIATDGFTRLRSVFTSTRTPSKGSARFLKHVVDELDITPSTREGWYKVTMRYTSHIARPWFVSAQTFYEIIVPKQQEKMLERRVNVLNDLASHL